MCSHEPITWEDIDNTVTDRMIDNSLMHKFLPSRKLRKRTMILNNEIKKNLSSVRDYKQYVKLKTNILRNLVEDIDIDDPGLLTDSDYGIIYSSPSQQAKYITNNTEEFIFISKCHKRNQDTTKKKEKSKNATRIQNRSTENIKNTRSTVKKKKPQTECHTTSSKKCINTGWQDVVKRDRDTLHLSNNQMRINISKNKENFSKDDDYDYLNCQTDNQSPSLFDSQNNMTSNIIKSKDENIDHQNREAFNAAHSRSNSEDTICDTENNTICNNENSTICNGETKRVNESNYEDQSETLNQSNNEFDSLRSHYLVSQSGSPIFDNINNAGNELNSVIKLKDNSNKLTETDDKSLISAKKHSDACVTNESNLLANVKRNIISALEQADSTDNNKDIKQDENVEDKLNDQLLPSVANSSPRGILLQKARTDVSKIQNLSSDNSSSDQQKDSGFDEDSQDKIEQSNIKNSANLDVVKKISVSPQQLKDISEIKKIKDSKNIEEEEKEVKDFKLRDEILDENNKEEKEPFVEKKAEDACQLNKDNKDAENYSINIEDKMHIVEQELCNIQDNRDEKSSEKEVKNLQLDQIDKNAEILINQEEEMHSMEISESCDIQMDARPETDENISKEQDDETTKKEENEENSLHLDQIDEDAKIYSQDKIHMESEENLNVQKEQTLPKITCTEIINKKYKIINMKINDIDDNIKSGDNININTSLINKDTPIKDDQSIVNHDIDDWQEVTNAQEIDYMKLLLETDDKEDNQSYISPQIKKRLQQQARLNLVVNDSSDSDEEHTNIEISRKRIDSSDTDHSNKDSGFKNEKIYSASEKANTDISYRGITYSKDTTQASIEDTAKQNMKRETEERTDETLPKHAYENYNSFKSTTDKNLSEETQSDDNQNKYAKDAESSRSKSPEINVLSDSQEYTNRFSRDKQSTPLDKQGVSYKSNQYEDSIRNCSREHETSCSEQSVQVSTNCSNLNANTSWNYRPYNLDELVEDHKLLPETISPSFTLADFSEDDEVFILNIPSNILQRNLQGEPMKIEERTIKFGKNKYRIRRKVGTKTCILATGKNRKPYKTVNIKEISTVTVREKLSHHLRKSDIIMSKSKWKLKKMKNREMIKSKMLKVLNRERKESSSSDNKTKQPAIKKRRLNIIHS